MLKTEICFVRGAYAEQHPRQLVHPAGVNQSRLERCLQMPMKALHQTVASGMISSCAMQLNAQTGSELYPPVGGDVHWYAKTSKPMRDQGPRARHRVRVRKWNGFGPTCEPVHDGKQVSKTA